MTREDLEEWHQPRMEALIGGKVSLLALETMPGSLEVNFPFEDYLLLSPSLT